jgi:GNAT superfamily N-acetyltransferase
LEYGFAQSLSPDLDVGGDVAQQWWVRVTEGERENGTAGPPVAFIKVVRGVLGEPRLWSALDAMEADLERVASTVLETETGDLVDDLDERIEPGGEVLLILNSVVVEPEWRGYGLGGLLAGVTLQTLAPGARLAAVFPAPVDSLRGAVRTAAVAKLGAVWAGLGFFPFRDGVWVLDLATVDLDEAVGRLRKRFGVEV